jgi:hypothetical protein
MSEVFRLDSVDAYALICADHLAMLPTIDQESMHRAIMNSSQVWLGSKDDQILAVWGLISPTLLSDVAYLWLFTTKHFVGHEFMLIRQSQRSVQAMLKEYSRIVGHGNVGHKRSLGWLRWLGAKFGEPQGNFLPFEIRAEQWHQDSAQLA